MLVTTSTILFSVEAGELFDCHVIRNRQIFRESELQWKELGYDGMALVRSPKMFD